MASEYLRVVSVGYVRNIICSVSSYKLLILPVKMNQEYRENHAFSMSAPDGSEVSGHLQHRLKSPEIIVGQEAERVLILVLT